MTDYTIQNNLLMRDQYTITADETGDLLATVNAKDEAGKKLIGALVIGLGVMGIELNDKTLTLPEAADGERAGDGA